MTVAAASSSSWIESATALLDEEAGAEGDAPAASSPAASSPAASSSLSTNSSSTSTEETSSSSFSSSFSSSPVGVAPRMGASDGPRERRTCASRSTALAAGSASVVASGVAAAGENASGMASSHSLVSARFVPGVGPGAGFAGAAA